MTKKCSKSKFFTPGRKLTLLLIVLLITGVFAEHVYALQPEGNPERGVYEGRLTDLKTGTEEADLLTGVEPSDSRIMAGDNTEEDSECLITLDAGEGGYFTDEEGARSGTVIVTEIKGQYFSRILSELPVPEAADNNHFAGWRLSEEEMSSGDLPGEISDIGEVVLEQDCTLCAVWEKTSEKISEKTSAGNGEQDETAEEPGDISGEEFDTDDGSAEEGQIQFDDGAESEQLGEQLSEQFRPDEDQPVTEGNPGEEQPEEENGPGNPDDDQLQVEQGAGEEGPELQETGIAVTEQDPQLQETEADVTEQDPQLQETEGAVTEQVPEPQETEGAGTDQDPEPQETEGAGTEQDPEPQETEADVTEQDPELQETEGAVTEQDPEPQETEADSTNQDPETQPQESETDSTNQDPETQLQETEAEGAELTSEQEQAQTGEALAEDESAAVGGKQEGQETAQEKELKTDQKETPLLAEDQEEEAVSEEAASAIASGLTPSEESKKQQESAGKAVTVEAVVSIRKAKITLSRTSYTYTGKAIQPGVTVVRGKTTLKKNRDYKVTFSANISVGTATAKITGIKKYRGTIIKTFKINRAAQKLTLKASASRVSAGRTMTVKAGGARETKKYSFKSSNKAVAKISSTGKITGVKVGTAKITVSTPATKNYKAGSKTITVKVVPTATKSLKASNQVGGIKLTWAKVAGANGYYLYRDGKRITTISKGSTVTWLDKKAGTKNKRYTYKIIAKASTGASTLSKSVGIRRVIKIKASSSTTARYCLEQRYVSRTLTNSKKNNLAVIDPTGISTSLIAKAKNRGVVVYGYINAGALEKTRKYYSQFEHLRICEYDGWPGEYWVDVTSSSWKTHLIDEAKKQKAAGVTGVYFDNVEIYYMVEHGFHGEHLYRDPPSQESVYKALSEVIKKIENEVGILVMPNCGDTFVRRFEKDNPGVILEVNVEGVLYEDFDRKSSEEVRYLTSYLDWCAGRGMITRGIEYTKSSSGAEKSREYYKKHGWTSVYISRHKDLEGD